MNRPKYKEIAHRRFILLKQLEWVVMYSFTHKKPFRGCWICGGEQKRGHIVGCELAEELQTIGLHIKYAGEPDVIIQSEEELGDD